MRLTTQRLQLRPTQAEDAAALFRILGNPAAMAFWDRDPYPRLATVEALLADELAAMAAGGFLYWTVLKDGDAIGSIDLSHIDGSDAWIGFLFRRDVWGQGFAREAVAAVIANAFGPLRLSRLMARIQSGNLRAARLLTALGFQPEGPLSDVMRDGVPRARARYGLDKSSSANGR